MTFDEIVTEVRLWTKRGDIDDKIKSAIREVTLRAHRLDYFWRDRIEAQVGWVAPQAIVDLNVVSVLTRFRAVDYVRYWEPSTKALGNFLDYVNPRDLMDDYNYEKSNRYYMAGDVLKLKFDIPSAGAQIGYFCNPVVYPYTSYASWIADQFPDLIIKGATAAVFNTTGKQEEARALNIQVGFDADPNPNRSAMKGASLVEQLRQFALEESAR